MAFTRSYRQSKLADAQFQQLGAGWIHNHAMTLLETAGPPNTILVRLPNGGEAIFYYTTTDGSGAHFSGVTGVGAEVLKITSPSLSYVLTAMDKSTFTFDASGRLISQKFASGDLWIYGYVSSKLSEANDGYGRKLVFRYYVGGAFDGLLYRVGDQTFDDTNPANPTGRYVEFSYTLNKVVDSGGNIVNGTTGLLTGVRDVRGNTWTYAYYGHASGETDVRQLNFLVERGSPLVDTTGDGVPDSAIALESVAYSMQGTELAVNGGMEYDSDWTAIVGAAPTTNERSTVQVDSGSYSRHVVTSAASQGIEGNAWDLVAGRTYIVTARVYPGSGTVKMGVAGETAFDRTSSVTGTWQTLRAVYQPSLGATGQKLQFTASGGAAEFYVDTVSITESNLSVSALTQERGDAALSTVYTFQPGGQNVTTESTAGKTTTHLFDDELYAGKQDPAGNVSGQSNNFVFRPDVQTDPNGNPTALRWSPDGKLLNQVIDALGTPTSFAYITDAGLNGGKSLDALSYSLDAQNRKTQYAYGDSGNPRLPTEVKVFDTDGVTVLRWQKFTYDNRGRTLTEQVVDPGNGTTVQQQVTRVYYTSGNGNGLLQTVTQQDLLNPANDVTTTYFYDSAGRVAQTNQTAMFGSCTSAYTVYNAAGDVVASICNYDPGTNPAPTTAAEAVALFNPALPDKNRVTTYEYDTLGRRVKVTTDAGAIYAQTTLTAYDALDRVIRTISNYVADVSIPNPYTAARSAFSHGADNTQNLITDIAYNERGLVQSQTDVLGAVTLFGYDDAGRLVKTVASASQPSYNNTYGVGGDPTLGAYVAGSAPDVDIVTSSQYDPAGNLVKTVDVLGNVTYTVYDVLNRPVKTVRSAKDTATIALSPGDPGYDATNDPRSASYVPSASPDHDLIDVTEYDTLGRVKRTQDTLGSWTLYGYDPLGRQVKVIRSASNPTYNMVTDPALANYSPSGAADLDLITSTTYDSQGRVLYTTDVQGQRTWQAYDGLNRAVKTIVNAVGTATDGGVNDPRSASYVPSTDSDKDLISVTTYDANGRVQWTQDPHGNKTWYVYDSVGRQKKAIQNCTYVSGTPAPEDDTYVGSSDADKDLISRTTFDAQGRVASTFDPGGNETRYTYDVLGRRIQTVVNYVDGVFNASFPDEDLISATAYDLAGRVVTTTDVRGTQTTFVYDALSRRLKATQAANTALATTSYTCYDKAGRVLRTISNYQPAPTDPSPDAKDGSGNWLFAPTTHGLHEDTNLIATFTLDKLGRGTQVADPLGNTTQTAYFKDGQVQAVTDPEGMITQYRYDAVRRRQIVVAGYQAGSFSDPATWYWDSGTSQWKDGSGTPITFGTNNDANIIVAAAYDKPGRMTSLRDPRGNLTQYAYDLLSRSTSLTDPLSHVWATAYANVAGGTTRVTATDPLTFQTQQDFDRAGRLATLQYLAESPKNTPDVTFSYDKLGDRTHMDETVDGGASFVRKTTYSYDKTRRLLSAGFDTDGNGTVDQTVSYQYDAGGLRTRLTLPGSLNVTYTYDTKGQLVSLTDWASQATSYAYDNVGRLIAAIRANGLRSAYTYDCAGRLRQLRHSKGKKVYGHFAYEVDKRGNRTQALEAVPQANTGATTMLYNDPDVWYYLGNWTAANPYQTTTNISAGVKLAFFGDQATLTMGQGPDHSIYDIYIDAALWASIDGYAASPGDRVISIALDNEGPHVIDIRNRPEKNTASSGYTLRFKSLATLASAPKYDLRTLKYTYDALARLLDARYYPGVNTSLADASLPRRYQYTYDQAGNRTQQIASVGGTPTTTNYTYDNANRITSDGSNAYVHDNAGRLISWANFPLTWDRANRVLSFAANGTSWIYNGVGQRLRSTIAGTTVTDYLLDVQPGLWRIIAFTDTELGGTMRYVHEPSGQHTVQYPNGTWFWPFPDALNSTRVVVNAGLAVDGTREFSPYGDIVNQTGGFLTFLDFTGELVDTGPMNYLRAREYYAAPGRFLSLDSLEGDMSQPMSLNRYMYVQGNVVNRVDPSGLCPSNEGQYNQCVQQQQMLEILYGIHTESDPAVQTDYLTAQRMQNIYDSVTDIVTAFAQELPIAAPQSLAGINLGSAIGLFRVGLGGTTVRLLLGNEKDNAAANTPTANLIQLWLTKSGARVHTKQNIVHEFGHILATHRATGPLGMVEVWDRVRFNVRNDQGWSDIKLRQNQNASPIDEALADTFLFWVYEGRDPGYYFTSDKAGAVRRSYIRGGIVVADDGSGGTKLEFSPGVFGWSLISALSFKFAEAKLSAYVSCNL